jgi:DNA polymerase-3 subunit beta
VRPHELVTFQATVLAGVMLPMLNAALSVRPRGGTESGLAGALLEVTVGSAKLVATDGNRLAYLEACRGTAGISGDHRSVVPWDTIIALQDLLQDAAHGDTVNLALVGSDLNLWVGARHLYGGPIVSAFPEYASLLGQERHHSVTVGRGTLENATKRVLASVGFDESVLRIRLESGQLGLMAPGSEAGWETLVTDYDGPDIEISLNSRYVLDALNAMDSARIILALTDRWNPVELSQPECANGIRQRFLIMPLRV